MGLVGSSATHGFTTITEDCGSLPYSGSGDLPEPKSRGQPHSTHKDSEWGEVGSRREKRDS